MRRPAPHSPPISTFLADHIRASAAKTCGTNAARRHRLIAGKVKKINPPGRAAGGFYRQATSTIAKVGFAKPEVETSLNTRRYTNIQLWRK
jgi:hypothetical protein